MGPLTRSQFLPIHYKYPPILPSSKKNHPSPLSIFRSNMSVSACRAPAALFQVESPPTDTRSIPSTIMTNNKDDEHADQSSIWAMIQSQKSRTPNATAAYVHPLMRGSPNVMSKSSLEMCTESLGSENGSGDFSDDDGGMLNSFSGDEEVSVNQKTRQQQIGDGEDENQQLSVNYHCSVSRRSPAPRSFPPPLTSISRHDGNCIQIRTRRQDGRLVVDAVPVVSPIFLNVRRQDGRLLLSFVDSTVTTQPNTDKATQKINQSQEEAGDEEEDEEEVEVVDRGSMVEVKVSTQPQQTGSAKKVLRSSLVINKFVGGTPLTNQNRWPEPAERNHLRAPLAESQTPLSTQHRLTASTTAAAAAVAASSASTSSQMIGQQLHLRDKKQLFTSNRRNREEMLHHMRRCSELRRPLFFWEAGCIATSS